MHFGVVGVTGNLGRRVVAEAVSRGHHVRAFTRDPANAADASPAVAWATIDMLDSGSVTATIGGPDVLAGRVQSLAQICAAGSAI